MEHIRWFYKIVLSKLARGPPNPADAPVVKHTLKSLSYLLGRRRLYVPKVGHGCRGGGGMPGPGGSVVLGLGCGA